jgi:hypothetical protein
MSRSLLAVPFCFAVLVPTLGYSADNLAGALKEGTTSLSFRLRHEQVEDDAFANDANASTLRTRLSYTSGQWNKLDLLVEFDHVGHLLDERFNDTRNGNTTFPTVADPKGADLNQAAVRYRTDGFTTVAGRQRILFDNQRFIGGVGWRQNEQTYDALRLTATPIDKLTLDYAWVSDTRRIFGPDAGAPAAALISDHHLLNIKYAASKAFTPVAYMYALDFADSAALSSQTIGAYFMGEAAIDSLTLDYRAEFARQSDYADNATDYDADYRLVSVGAKLSGIRLGLASETLGADSDAGVAFATPLATGHAFQGWADKFLNTPANGIVDNYVSLGGAVKGVNLLAMWHDYERDSGNVDLGDELNLQASKKFSGNYTLTLKYADYSAGDVGTDAQKIWLMAEAVF